MFYCGGDIAQTRCLPKDKLTVEKPAPLETAMRKAAAEARLWLGSVAPNPPVGAAALDAGGNIIAVAAHHRAGEAHAEALLLQQCRERGMIENIHTLCVTLEPCNHHGRTPPCCDAIIANGIRRVAVGCRDPNPHVQGGGIERLRAAGVEIIENIVAEECQQLIRAFRHKAITGRPWITVKQAINRDGTMLPPSGQKTFTSPESLRLAHLLRKRADALITGSGTVLSDYPLFTVRHVTDYPGKQRHLVIMDRRGRVPPAYIDEARTRNLVVTTANDLHEAVGFLSHQGITEILIEAGPTLTEAVRASNLWMEWVQITAHNEPLADNIKVSFNRNANPSFNGEDFCWDYVLPQETAA
ncbi:MAG: bifunctional diaminohydroxyphosphoribosylaminopyrimidine deaminase/5-amino-6-(5-phosphoribosylamino)uracil reductase RibD [Alphaproteobacteria bacterium]|nr:bifunctional diaminohydroxyphosphoribosylaminopyrimidine deaminase/5-amino-6-(5-phosphoribosylamino)uracil reductase RibD [Alphaproteobacteria bacterium]MBV8549492.1 bifunctional diaminohydroxyphosphoribosylaminopyrimidine deaminase/5-amino-6-(5-phosphoribosylamino)uracil reductase RibD [Alphaproteobacteria bacterium]